MERLGAVKIFWRVKLKPGTPSLFSLYKKTPVISLSGNPFGAAANFELLIRPVLAKMTRDNTLLPVRKKGMMNSNFFKASIERRFIRGIYEEGKVFLPKGLHSSGVLGSMKGCNCLIDIPPGTDKLSIGDFVDVWLI